MGPFVADVSETAGIQKRDVLKPYSYLSANKPGTEDKYGMDPGKSFEKGKSAYAF